MSEEMKAGTELDAHVAMNVMGWRPHMRNTAHWTDADSVDATDYRVRGYVDEWSPSTDINAAWAVVTKLRESGWLVRVQEMPNEEPFLMGAGWRDEENLELHMRAMCQLYPSKKQRTGRALFRDVIDFADSTPLAICRAALKAVASAP